MGYNHDTREDYESKQNLSGFDAVMAINKTDIDKCQKAAKALSLNIKFRDTTNGMCDILTPEGQDLTEFWEKTGLLN